MNPDIDVELQSQVDAQLLEQGAYTALEWLIDSGRLPSEEYEAWRRREIDCLDAALMGDKQTIRAQLESAAAYARRIGLVEQAQEFHAWGSNAADGDAVLRISTDLPWQRLIAARYLPAQNTPQMDLFFDNPIVALTNGMARALCDRQSADAHRLLDLLYSQAPNHADLPAFDALLAALDHLDRPVEDPRRELHFLREVAPAARRLLGFQSRDLLAPLWRQLAAVLAGRPFRSDEPDLHCSFALSQAQDWAAAADSVRGEPQWWLHAALCLRLALCAFQGRNRPLALTAWCHLCWREPDAAADALEHRRHPDSGVTALWQHYVASAEELTPSGESWTAAGFPAWLLLHEPGLAQQLPEDLPTDDTPAEEGFRSVHRWIEARRAGRSEEEMALRKVLQAGNPMLFRHLKQSLGQRA